MSAPKCPSTDIASFIDFQRLHYPQSPFHSLSDDEKKAVARQHILSRQIHPREPSLVDVIYDMANNPLLYAASDLTTHLLYNNPPLFLSLLLLLYLTIKQFLY